MANVVRVGVETDGKMGVLFDATADFAVEVVTQLDFEDRLFHYGLSALA